MQSFIISSSSTEKRSVYIQQQLLLHSVSQFDVTRIIEETSIGIERIRDIQKQLFFKPLKGDTKAIILEDAQTLTPEAQSALLKVLEEPPLDSLFFLSSTTYETFLPTILSRC